MKCERWKFKAINAESCPFCGSNSVSVAHKDVRYIGQNKNGIKKLKMKAYCVCNKCHSRGKPIFYIGYANAGLNGYSEDYLPVYACGDKAIENWNMRGEIVMERFLREMTFEEEYSFLQKEAKELFDKEDGKSDPPIANCIVRRALRCINKLLKEVEPYREYEDLEEQGLLLRLPCKVGDTVWELCKCDDGIYRIFPMKITRVVPYGSPLKQKGRDTDIWNIYAISDYTDVYKSFYDIGKTVFLTKEEAERQIELEALRYVTTDIDDLL